MPLAPEADKSDAAVLMFSEASVETVWLLLEEPVELLAEEPVELLVAVEDELKELEALGTILVGVNVSLPTPKPIFDA